MKKINSEKKGVKRQQNKFIIYNFIAFTIIFVILGVLAVILINNFFFSDIEEDLKVNQRYVKETIREDRERISWRNNSDARLLFVFYDENEQLIACSNEIYSYLIEDYYQYIGADSPFFPNSDLKEEYLLEVENAKNNNIFIINLELDTINRFERVNTGDESYYFMSTSFAIDNDNAPNVKMCKLLVMVNGEINTSRALLTIYIFCVALIILLCALASILLSQKTIKPINEALNKQLAFVGDASHELRTPLSIVQSKLENILTKSEQTVYDVSEDIAISLKEISRLNKLTSDLLTLARSDNNREILNLKQCRVDEVVNETAQIFSEMASLNNKQFVIDVVEVVAFVDEDKIRQLLIILLDNALRYTEENDLITIKLEKTSNDFIITISDTGIGMNDDTMHHIFERFYRADKARSRETGGNGLGLSIAKLIVSSHKGKIKVDHNQPKGSVFTIEMPRIKK